MYRDGYIISRLKIFFYRHFKILDNSEDATYNENIKSSEYATIRKGGMSDDREQQDLYYCK